MRIMPLADTTSEPEQCSRPRDEEVSSDRYKKIVGRDTTHLSRNLQGKRL
jgi:hypothetical protein